MKFITALLLALIVIAATPLPSFADVDAGVAAATVEAAPVVTPEDGPAFLELVKQAWEAKAFIALGILGVCGVVWTIRKLAGKFPWLSWASGPKVGALLAILVSVLAAVGAAGVSGKYTLEAVWLAVLAAGTASGWREQIRTFLGVTSAQKAAK